MTVITGVKFEHYSVPDTIGVQETAPRISWQFQGAPSGFEQESYEIDISEENADSKPAAACKVKCSSSDSRLVPWPDKPLSSRRRICARVRAWDKNGQETPWSDPAFLEIGLLKRSDWHCQRIAAPWATDRGPEPEQLFRKEFPVTTPIAAARLYITAQGVYEAEINGQKVGDQFMPPGWTIYSSRIEYQTYDVTALLSQQRNCLAVRVAEGWFCGRLGWEGGRRGIWGPHPALMAQLEIRYTDGREEVIATDASWAATRGPIQLAEIYDGEKYDANLEVPNWSVPSDETQDKPIPGWQSVLVLPALPDSVELTAGFGEPVRRTETLKPHQKITTPSGKTIIDFGQNLVGYARLSNVKGSQGDKITLSHAEVLENGELGTRPLRICKATDEYILKGDNDGESYEPRFTFHGFRYVQIDGWPSGAVDLESSIEAVVCHTDMKSVGSFSCSNSLINKFYENVKWGMRGNFLSIPTDCPQRDERLGWTGDLAMFAPTATLIYDCYGMLKSWLLDVESDQTALGGVPALVTPNTLQEHAQFSKPLPTAVWGDVAVLGPWTLYEESGDTSILVQQYSSMSTWVNVIPRNSTGAKHLWDSTRFQFADWLDPAAPPDAPWKAVTDPTLVANAFLIRSLDIMVRVATILGRDADKTKFEEEAKATRKEFLDEYVTPSGRLASDSQTAYALAICFDLLSPAQKIRAGDRLVDIVKDNEFKIGTGFAGTPFVCEALVQTGHIQVAYSMILTEKCPSWLYPVTMGATTIWERWDSMLPDGSINPGEMTSFNHYALGAVAKFLFERLAGLQRLEPGWKRCRVGPCIGAEFSGASADHLTPYGRIATSWEVTPKNNNNNNDNSGNSGGSQHSFKLVVSVPTNVTVEVVLPDGDSSRTETVGAGDWTFETVFTKRYEWPVAPTAIPLV